MHRDVHSTSNGRTVVRRNVHWTSHECTAGHRDVHSTINECTAVRQCSFNYKQKRVGKFHVSYCPLGGDTDVCGHVPLGLDLFWFSSSGLFFESTKGGYTGVGLFQYFEISVSS